MLYFSDFSTGGGSEIIDDGTVSGGEIVFSGLDLSSYYTIRLYLSGIKVNADDNAVALQLEMGGSVISAGYQYGGTSRISDATNSNPNSASSSFINLHPSAAANGVGTDTGELLAGYIDIGNAVSTLDKFVTAHMAHRQPDTNSVYTTISGRLANTSNITGFRIFCSDVGGSLTAGRAFLMGLS